MKKKFMIIFCILMFISVSNYSQESEEDEDNMDTKKDYKENTLKKYESKKLTTEAYYLLRIGKLMSLPAKIKKLKEISPNSNESIFLQAGLDYSNRKYDSSIKLLKKSLRINPDHDRSHYLLGMNYYKNGEWKKALEPFSKAVEKDPYNPFYRNNLSIIAYINENYEESVSHSIQAIELKQNYNEPKFTLLLSLYNLKKYAEVIKYYDDYHVSSFKNFRLDFIYFDSLLKRGDDLQLVIQKIITKAKLSDKEKNLLARTYILSGEYEIAMKTLEPLVKKKDTEVEIEEFDFYIKQLVLAGKKREIVRLTTMYNNNYFENTKKREKFQIMSELLYRMYFAFP